MTNPRQKARRSMLICGAAMAAALAATPALAQDQIASIDIPAQPMAAALKELARQSGANLLFSLETVKGLQARAVQTSATPEQAARMLLAGTDLSVMKDSTGSLIVQRASDPQSGSAAGDGADGTVAALIVTAQKREEQIQDVPIAISAFTEKSLEEQKIEGGFDLLKAIPNVTFSKNNFTSYNFSIRGIGTKAVSATTDPGVAVAFNNAALIQNRLFEQEYFDVERVEVLRGPQGTLYGRNATAGVINVISAKPDMNEFRGSIKGEVGNYHAKRLVGVMNLPLVEDKLAVRFAGSLTSRSGYDFNDVTKHAVNGRDLWSARVTVAFNPKDTIHTSVVWERFNENDNRSRTGKQLCKRDPGPEAIGAAPVGDPTSPALTLYQRGAFFSQGCSPVSLYDDSAFQTPNGYALPFVSGASYLGFFFPLGNNADGNPVTILSNNRASEEPGVAFPDPYASLDQAKDMRVISSFRDPIYRAKADIVQLNVSVDLSPALTFTSQTTYDKDEVYSFQDYNRFNTAPIFANTSGITIDKYNPVTQQFDKLPSPYQDFSPGGVFCDPQIGCSSSIAGFDISKATSTQFLQEIRLESNFDGPINFSVGANYTRFKVLADYYVMFNLLTAIAETKLYNTQTDITLCGLPNHIVVGGFFATIDPVPITSPDAGCPYIDPNPVESIDGEGHNYFRSKNPYKLGSVAVFGEAYWRLSEQTKVTIGLRYTDDRKTFTPVPSQLLLATHPLSGGTVNKGYPEEPDIKQHWGEVTGRIGIDYKPELSFTDQTMLYAFYSRGYKGGGANPPQIGFSKTTLAEAVGLPPDYNPSWNHPIMESKAQNTKPTFDPEFVNAFEVGAKNTLLGGALIFNGDAFFYDYKAYQVSKVIDRTVANENFDARVWGLEFEMLFSPSRNLRMNANFGYLDTDIGKGARSIDVMNRTQGDPDYVLVKPWLTYPSNCVVPKSIVEATLLQTGGAPGALVAACGSWWLPRAVGLEFIDPNTQAPYDPDIYPINGGAGIAQDLEGHELPNSPHWTTNLGVQYAFEVSDNWRATVRADGYWQSQSWARVYNAVNDKLHGWYNANLSLWLERPEDGLKIELYAKNILDKTPITDSFINSDDTALTTNVFVLDPRLIGLSIRKEF